jgi:hypothetical protein
VCSTDGRCVACGGEGEICCGTACDDDGFGCFAYICQPGSDQCPEYRPSSGASCDYLGTDYCAYPQGLSNVLCQCSPDGWHCYE